MTAALVDALHGLAGVTIRVRHPLHDASMRLMGTLGVTVVVDPDAPECERVDDRTGAGRRCRQCGTIERRRAA